MTTIDRLKLVLADALQIGERAETFTERTALLGAIPEFDSMAVVNVLTMIEDEFGITVDDEEMSAEVFETLGTLTRFVESKAGV
jgi:acyl carrier protein